MFKDITENSGISYTGSSYGSAWGDFNNDGFVDLWLSNHGSGAILYQNQGDGTFIKLLQMFLSVNKQYKQNFSW